MDRRVPPQTAASPQTGPLGMPSHAPICSEPPRTPDSCTTSTWDLPPLPTAENLALPGVGKMSLLFVAGMNSHNSAPRGKVNHCST